MLTGVWADSSARMKDGWLSDEACLVGMSRPEAPMLLMGLEKLREGRGTMEESEATDGDLRKEPATGECTALVKAMLAEDNVRGGR